MSDQSQYADLDYSGMHEFKDEETDEAYGSFEVFQGFEYLDPSIDTDPDCEPIDPNDWYWWPCFPGCLPDGDPCGPFDTSADAYHDAMGF